ncbi:MAG: aminotransferase class I/II-fold pyridoxal phosphate-dependent enzyme [Candidatus Omnitrophica bacterium]|nr:aminotransferase class I/II-fold pyridoxal phosphate-dependent enzyme [Candidatus Omnitrophota bacterium]
MISKRVKKLAPSGIRAFFDLVMGMPEVISLGVGEPDFISPWRVREKAITALEEGMTSYTSNQGLFVLRRDIANHYKRRFSLSYDPKTEILITVGVSEALDLALRAILEPKDKVIVVTPHYVAYPALVEISGGQVLYLTTKAEDNFKIDIKRLKELLKANPKAIILNNPSNPTGTHYTSLELKKIWKVIANKKTLVISDEVYDELIYDQKHSPFASLSKEAKKRTILLNGFSKGYAMTGFRVGYACASQEIIAAMSKIHSFSIMCVPTISQVAASEALLSQKEVIAMRSAYRRRRELVVKELNRLGLTTNLPQGAFYCFPSLEKFKIDSLSFAKKLLFEQKVAVVPGVAFGKELSSYIRISYANSLDNLKEAIIRIEKFLGKLK